MPILDGSDLDVPGYTVVSIIRDYTLKMVRFSSFSLCPSVYCSSV